MTRQPQWSEFYRARQVRYDSSGRVFGPSPRTLPDKTQLTYLITYLLTPWCRVLLEKLTGLQLVKKFPAFHGTRRFITALTSARQLSLLWASPVQSIYPHPTSYRSIAILSTYLRLGLPSGSFPPHPYAPRQNTTPTRNRFSLRRGIRTRNPSKQAGAYSRFGPCGHRDRPVDTRNSVL